MNEFKEIGTPPDTVIHVYQHVDNGGYTISVDRYGGLTINVGFFGYSETTVLMPHINLPSLIEVLTKANNELEKQAVISALKGE